MFEFYCYDTKKVIQSDNLSTLKHLICEYLKIDKELLKIIYIECWRNVYILNPIDNSRELVGNIRYISYA